MQHIGLCRKTETGEVLAQFDLDGLDPRIIERAPPASTCLRFIDPYGDTIFNQLQLPLLVSELAEMRAAAGEADLQAHIDRVLVFLRDSEEVHIYVCFVGD
jgi:hypothetical protein